MKIKKWESIDKCPDNYFLALLRKGFLFKIKIVYVHVDNHFLQWKDLRYRNGLSIGSWKCIYYISC